ncbi:MAG TPA: hypothetical protein VL854_02415 [Nitrososphaeraceae archaeon]|nr:hypothetical protein [Nitrososphaeraceae archaeon]
MAGRLKRSEPLLRDELDIIDPIQLSPKIASTLSLRARIPRLLASSGAIERKPDLEKMLNGKMEPDTRPV